MTANYGPLASEGFEQSRSRCMVPSNAPRPVLPSQRASHGET